MYILSDDEILFIVSCNTTNLNLDNAIEGSMQRVADRVLQDKQCSIARTMLHLCWLQYELVTLKLFRTLFVVSLQRYSMQCF
jgi:hypothetical protein